jgi:hypothetical protein
MYAPTYGFGQGGSNAQQQAGFNPNAPSAAPPIPVPQYFQGQQQPQPQHHHHQQQQPPPSQQQQQQQQQQQMMYNSQQYGVGSATGGPQQNPYAGLGVNPAMMQGSGGMAHMAVNNGVGMLHRIPGTSSAQWPCSSWLPAVL